MNKPKNAHERVIVMFENNVRWENKLHPTISLRWITITKSPINKLMFNKLSKSKTLHLTTSSQSSSLSSLSSCFSSLSRNISNLSNASAACTLLPNASAVCLKLVASAAYLSTIIFLLSINLFCALQSCMNYNSLINTIIASILEFTIP